MLLRNVRLGSFLLLSLFLIQCSASDSKNQNPPAAPSLPNGSGVISVQDPLDLPGNDIGNNPSILPPVNNPEDPNNNNGNSANNPALDILGDLKNGVPRIDVSNLAQAIAAEQEAKRQQVVQQVSLLNTFDDQSTRQVLGANSLHQLVLNELTLNSDASSLQSANFMSGANFIDASRDVLDFHHSSGRLSAVSISPNENYYAQCSYVALQGDFSPSPSSRCQINNFLPAASQLRQIEIPAWVRDIYIDNNRNLWALAYDDASSFVRVYSYHFGTQTLSSQVLASPAFAQQQQIPQPMNGHFDFSKMSDVKIILDDTEHLFIATLQANRNDYSGISNSVNLYRCDIQGLTITGSCVKKEILREGSVVENNQNPDLFYRGTQLKFERGSLVLMESLFFKNDHHKEILFHNYTLNNLNSPALIKSFSYEATTPYYRLQWVRNPLDERDFFICGSRDIRGGSGTQQVDCMTWSYAFNQNGIQNKYDNLFRFSPWDENNLLLTAPISNRGPVLYVVYRFADDFSGDRSEGVVDAIANFIQQTKRGHANYISKLMKIQFRPFEIR